MSNRDNADYKMVIVTREDLKLSPGKLAVQVAHAAVECALETKKTKPKWFKKWKESGSKKVVVRVEGLKEMHDLRDLAERLGMIAIIIKDAGLTEIPPGTETVLGIGPAPSNTIDRVTGSLPLM
ncbi:MAG TPA: peptidyl-tRNA hydrolase [Thermoplasmatales archaeon]|nr:peptidyl-tRNA hydrolase [Thermoplasmatales archaeon]